MIFMFCVIAVVLAASNFVQFLHIVNFMEFAIVLQIVKLVKPRHDGEMAQVRELLDIHETW